MQKDDAADLGVNLLLKDNHAVVVCAAGKKAKCDVARPKKKKKIHATHSVDSIGDAASGAKGHWLAPVKHWSAWERTPTAIGACAVGDDGRRQGQGAKACSLRIKVSPLAVRGFHVKGGRRGAADPRHGII
jgi:hypothetical protein